MDPRDFAHLILWAIGLYLLLRFFVRPMMAAISASASLPGLTRIIWSNLKANTSAW